MAKETYLNRLFDAHTKDLNDLHPGMGDVIVCPICLRIIPREAISQKLLTDGHVWPKDMRKKSKIANDQTVLLCKDCNNSPGGQGDAQMQLFERIKENSEVGELYGIRTVDIVERPEDQPIQMRVRVNKDDHDFITVSGKLDQNKKWLGSSPEDQIQFEKLVKKSTETQQQLRITIHPPHEYKSNLVRAGWVTDAYLMAFYTFGYRYILNKDLDFIRAYITSSFNPDYESTLALPAREDFHIYTGDNIDYPDPAIRISIPLTSNVSVRLEVCFLKYEVCLPLPLEPDYFKAWLSVVIKHLPQQQLPPAKEGEFPCLYVYTRCSKTTEHTCIFDYLLGKSFPI
jgi:hypothetical protein